MHLWKKLLTVAVESVIVMNLATPCRMTAEQLETGLRYELKPLAQTFVEIEDEYGINSALYASVVSLESGWGRSDVSQEKNNITSFTVDGELKAYSSKEECLWDMAENLSGNYLDEDGIYYDGGTWLEDVASYYLVGKPKEELTRKERKAVDSYVETVEDIYKGILKRGGALTESLT